MIARRAPIALALGLLAPLFADSAALAQAPAPAATPAPPATAAARPAPPSEPEPAREAEKKETSSPAAAVPRVAPAPSPVPGPSPEELRERRVKVDIDSARPATVVERRITTSEKTGIFFFLPYHSNDSTWEQVCVTPCSVDLDRYSTYRVGKVNGVVASSSFTLPQQLTDRLTIHIEPGSALANHIGMSATAIGVAAIIVGGALVGAEKLFSDQDAARNAGFITGGAGIVLFGVGLPLAVLTRTKIFGPASTRVAITPKGLVF